MAARHAVANYDADLARKQTAAELRSKAAPQPTVLDCNKPGGPKIELSADAKAKMRNAAQLELAKITARLEERRRRDPTFKETALDLDRSQMLPFSKLDDYYAELGVEQYVATASELREAYRKLSLRWHPDKQSGKLPDERAEAAERLHAVKKAYAILCEPATRQAYDRARARLEAEYEAGVVVTYEETRPPPSLVEVAVTLEETFTGCLKYVRYNRSMFAGTKWERKEDDVFTLKVRPGETVGATFWFRERGDVSTRGKSDLVFVLKLAEHAEYERLGPDLWLRHDAPPLPAEQLLFAALVPTLELSRNWQGPVARGARDRGAALALGHTLDAALGFDRSGWSEAIVAGRGVPLLAANEDARRGRGEMEERQQELGAGDKQTLAMQAKAEVQAFAAAPRGDMVVKFRVTPPRARRRAWLPQHALLQPPLALLTSQATAAGGHRRALPAAPLNLLSRSVLLPALLHRLAVRREVEAAARAASASRTPSGAALAAVGLPLEAAEEAAQTLRALGLPSAQPPLRASACFGAVCLCICVGDSSASGPLSESATQFMSHWSALVPQAEWRIVRVVEGVETLLLPDEEDAIADASLLLMELRGADAAAAGGGGVKVFSAAEGRLVPAPVEPRLYDDAPKPRTNSSSADICAVREFRVVRSPGVRIRAQPHPSASVVGMLRANIVVRAHAAAAADEWLQLDTIGDDSSVRGYVRLRDRASGALLVPATPALAADDAESEDDEVALEEKRVAQARAERDYFGGEAAAARALLSDECVASALGRCHTAGGVLVALDRACALLGRDGGQADAKVACARAWPAVLPYLVGLAPPKPPASCRRHRASWRRLRHALVRLGGAYDDGSGGPAVSSSSLRFGALGLPPGAVVAVLPQRGWAVRETLGSAATKKLELARAREREVRVANRQRRNKVERQRTKVLAQLEVAFRQAALEWPPEPSAVAGRDYAGVLRGQCTECLECPGYMPSNLDHAPTLAMVCCACGCECSVHEQLRDDERRRGDSE